MAFMLPDDSPGVSAKVEWVDAHGHPAVVDGDTSWSSSDPAIATVTVDATDSTKAMVMPGASLGPVQIVASADADMGSGTTTIMATGDLEVVAGQAMSGSISFTP